MSFTKNNTLQDYNITTANKPHFESKERPTFYGIYIGIVKDNRDVMKMGRLRVYIPEISSDPNDEKQWVTVDYVSPFAGATNPLLVRKDGKTMRDVQQSYGFWFVPPDLNNLVIVAFINGEPSRGVWFGCLYQNQMNHMVPGIPPGKSFQEGYKNIDPPVVEYNKRKNNETVNPFNPLRPRFDPLHESLLNQGLYEDAVRGPSNAGARRESPSQVYGFKTPRGHHIVIDDGEIEIDETGQPVIDEQEIKRRKGTEEYIKIRTRSGTQILINDTNGYIYLITKNGNSWAELNDNGIYLYTNGTFNVRSENSINLHSDTDINLHAAGSIHLRAENNISMRAENRFDLSSDNLHVQADDRANLHANSRFHVSSGEKIQVKANNNIEMKGKEIHLNSFDLPEAKKAKYKRKIEHEDIKNMSKTTTQSIVDVLVTHEPFKEHPSRKTMPTIKDEKTLDNQRDNGFVVLNDGPRTLELPSETETGTEEPFNTSCIDIVSAEFESRGDPAAIGYDGPGGWSYGAYQIATNTGTMDAFIRWLKIRYPDTAKELESVGGAKAAREGDSQFKQKWIELAKKDNTFRKQQHEFIAETHTKPVNSMIKSKYGIDPTTRSKTLQSVIYSTSVQHGPNGAKKIVERALEGKNPSVMSDEEIIKAIYAERFAKDPTSPTGLKYFRNPTLVKYQKGLIRRAEAEPARALQLLQEERKGNLSCT